MAKAARQAILPFFIPMQGCSYRCVYCDQHSISGCTHAPSPREITETALSYAGSSPAQLAFYGGSFTALPWPQQEAYLQAAQAPIRAGKISSIRISTRPDALDASLLQRLADWGVATVELGIQSFDGQVLAAAGRAYTPQAAVEACALVQKAGLQLGIQLMTGLPEDTDSASLSSMMQTCAIGPDFVRIYPTVVLQNTPLAELYRSGDYQPQSLDEAARLCGDMLALALAQNITVIRMGLNPSPSLEKSLIAGAYHPAFGQLARSALKQQQALLLLGQVKHPVALGFPPRERPLVFGQRNGSWQAITALYRGLRAEPAPELLAGSLRAIADDGYSLTLTQDDFLRQYCAINK